MENAIIHRISIYIKKKGIWNLKKKTFENHKNHEYFFFFLENYKIYENTKYLYFQGIYLIYASYS